MLPTITRALRQHPAIWAITTITLALHLATAGRYDIFRNELYYIVCGRHPAFGYADEPPLVPLIAAATQLFGINVWLLRLPAALAGAALIPLTASFARLLGGNTTSAVIAALAAATAPALIALTQILTTSTFEPLAWTACAYCLARAVLLGERRALLWAGLVTGLAMQAKYGIDIWLIGLLAGMLLTPARKILATRECATGLAIAALVAVPSLIWQTLNGWPFLAVMTQHTVTHSNFTGTPLQFEIMQAFAMNVILTPLWLTGLIAPFASARLRPARFLAIAYVAAAAIDIAARGKDYYLFPAYPALFAIGAAACANLSKFFSIPWMVLATTATAAIAPIVLPLLPPPALAAYLDKYHLHPKPDERAAVGAPLTQVFSDELGWRDLEKSVAAIYRALPPDEQARAAIVASNYGEAAAIDVYGAADHLPPALSGQDQYYLWGPRGYDGNVTIHINGDPERWRPNCQSLTMAGTFGAPYVMPYENDRPIFICRGIRVPLTEAWHVFKRFQ
jgi:4-amino-4-deoxy-L-arabinose transferase-like glycosyltransferase